MVLIKQNIFIVFTDNYLLLFSLITSRSIGMKMYFYVHKHWRLCDLPWDSTSTWVVGLIGMDFLYYWFHRAAHGELFLIGFNVIIPLATTTMNLKICLLKCLITEF